MIPVETLEYFLGPNHDMGLDAVRCGDMHSATPFPHVVVVHHQGQQS